MITLKYFSRGTLRQVIARQFVAFVVLAVLLPAAGVPPTWAAGVRITLVQFLGFCWGASLVLVAGYLAVVSAVVFHEVCHWVALRSCGIHCATVSVGDTDGPVLTRWRAGGSDWVIYAGLGHGYCAEDRVQIDTLPPFRRGAVNIIGAGAGPFGGLLLAALLLWYISPHIGKDFSTTMKGVLGPTAAPDLPLIYCAGLCFTSFVQSLSLIPAKEWDGWYVAQGVSAIISTLKTPR